MPQCQSGIYKIEHVPTGRIYVGSAKNIKARWACHVSDLRLNRHGNGKLQNSWNKNGESDFSFEVVESVENTNDLVMREQFYLDETQPYYNICRVAGSTLGVKRTAEANRKNGLVHKGKKLSKKHIESIVSANTGRKASTKTRQKMCLAQQVRVLSSESKANIIKSLTGRFYSEETRAKLSVSQIKRFQDNGVSAETRQKLSDKRLGVKMSAQTIERMCVAQKGRVKPAHVIERLQQHNLAKAKYFVVISPDGTEQNIRGLKTFCKANSLTAARMTDVAKGKSKAHKGWLCQYATIESEMQNV